MVETEQTNEGDQTPKPTFLDTLEAKKVELKELNDSVDKKLIEFKDLKAQDMMSGGTTGRQPQVEPKPLSDIEYANKVMKGEANPLGDDGISIN